MCGSMRSVRVVCRRLVSFQFIRRIVKFSFPDYLVKSNLVGALFLRLGEKLFIFVLSMSLGSFYSPIFDKQCRDDSRVHFRQHWYDFLYSRFYFSWDFEPKMIEPPSKSYKFYFSFKVFCTKLLTNSHILLFIRLVTLHNSGKQKHEVLKNQCHEWAWYYHLEGITWERNRLCPFHGTEFARTNEADSQNDSPSKGTDRYRRRRTSDRRTGEGNRRKVGERDLVVSIGVIKSILWLGRCPVTGVLAVALPRK